MKKLIAVALLVCSAVTLNAQVQGKNFIDMNYIEVAGYNKTEVTPDKIFINFRINEADTKGRISVAQLERDVIAAFRRIGIDVQNKLTVSDMSSGFKKYLLRGQDVMNSKDYTVEVGSAAVASQVFDELDKAGVANASVQRVDHSDMENIIIQSRAAAVRNAQAKARALAEAVGQKAGRALYIQDIDRTYSPVVYRAAVVKSTVLGEAAGGGDSSLEFEDITVESNVTVCFALE